MAVILIAGAIGSGKTTVAAALALALGGETVRVRNALADVLGVSNSDRIVLQESGADLDRRTNGRWLVEYIERRLEFAPLIVVDSMRTRLQTVPVLESFPSAFLAYLDARPETRRQRFELAKQTDLVKRSLAWTDAMRHPTEAAVAELRPLAHLRIETDGLESDRVVSEIIAALRPIDP
jgi:cytidylate kinase